MLDKLNEFLISRVYAQQNGATIPNPLGSDDIIEILRRIVGYLIVLAAPIVVAVVIYGGFKIATSAGDPAKFKEGTKAIIYALVGYAIILVSWGVITLVKQLLGIN